MVGNASVPTSQDGDARETMEVATQTFRVVDAGIRRIGYERDVGEVCKT